MSLAGYRGTHLLHGDGKFAALVQEFAHSVGRVTVALGQFGHISLDPSDHTFHLHLMHLNQDPAQQKGSDLQTPPMPPPFLNPWLRF